MMLIVSGTRPFLSEDGTQQFSQGEYRLDEAHGVLTHGHVVVAQNLEALQQVVSNSGGALRLENR